MIMKMHSYTSFNGYLYDISQRSRRVLAHLRSLAEDPSIGGWDKAFLDAKANIESSSSEAHSEAEPDSQVNVRGTEVVIISSLPDSQPPDALRQRLMTAANGTVVELGAPVVEDTTPDFSRPSTPDAFDPLSLTPTTVSILCHHPSQAITSVAHEFLELDAELVSTGTERVRYPQNLTWKNFCTYMLIPTLVYELEYPRTDR
jgi:sterol O-acyltransferase